MSPLPKQCVVCSHAKPVSVTSFGSATLLCLGTRGSVNVSIPTEQHRRCRELHNDYISGALEEMVFSERKKA